MKLNDLFIADGVINEYVLESNHLTIQFTDYRGNKYSIKAINCTKLFERGSVGFSLFGAKATDTTWVVEDDDGVVLSVEFSNVEVKSVS